MEDEIGDDLVGCVFGCFLKRWDLFFGFWRGDRIGSCFFWVFFCKNESSDEHCG